MSYADNKAKMVGKKISNKHSLQHHQNQQSHQPNKSIDLSKMGLSEEEQLKYHSLIQLITKENFP